MRHSTFSVKSDIYLENIIEPEYSGIKRYTLEMCVIQIWNLQRSASRLFIYLKSRIFCDITLSNPVKLTVVSEENTASIFKMKENNKQITSM
jgi:hypothetical protein